MLAWWVFWIGLSRSDLNDFTPPSAWALAQFALLLTAFLAGHAAMHYRQVLWLSAASHQAGGLKPAGWRLRVALRGAVMVCSALLLVSLWRSGALTSNFVEYFAKLRLEEDGAATLSGIRVLDVLTKILAFPLSYTVILIVLASGVQHCKATLAMGVCNLLAFSYLWQVNYPLIHLFWFLVFYSLVQARRRGAFGLQTMLVMLVVLSTLLASAVNRFGGDIIGGLQRYIVGYHLIGFSFYDFQFQDPHSILHNHSFGRSSLGFLDQMLEALSKVLGLGYQAASFENSTYNNEALDLGRSEVREFNAFGTLLFSLYRDFHVAGIVIGGFFYGAVATYALRRSDSDWICGAVFMLLASSWMMGMMVNPLEQAYFWFAVVALGAFALVSRGVRL